MLKKYRVGKLERDYEQSQLFICIDRDKRLTSMSEGPSDRIPMLVCLSLNMELATVPFQWTILL